MRRRIKFDFDLDPEMDPLEARINEIYERVPRSSGRKQEVIRRMLVAGYLVLYENTDRKFIKSVLSLFNLDERRQEEIGDRPAPIEQVIEQMQEARRTQLARRLQTSSMPSQGETSNEAPNEKPNVALNEASSAVKTNTGMDAGVVTEVSLEDPVLSSGRDREMVASIKSLVGKTGH